MAGSREIVRNLFFVVMPLIKKVFGQMDRQQPDIHELILDKNSTGKKEVLMFLHLEVMYLVKEAGSVRMSDLAKKMDVSAPNLTVLVDKLVDGNLVKREPDISDRRAVLLVLTEKGAALLGEKQEKLEQYLERRFSALKDEEKEELNAALHILGGYLDKIVNQQD